MTIDVKGIAASKGIAIAKAFLLEEADLTFERKAVDDPDTEIERLDKALMKSLQELEEIKAYTEEELGSDKAEIFAAHILVLKDPELLNPIKEKIQLEKVNAEGALNETATMFISMFENMDNEYMKERAADIRDVTKRVLAHLLGVRIANPKLISEEVIIIAKDLTPSDTAQLNRNFVLGFCTDIGGRTSHSAIMARSMEIPAVVGTEDITTKVKTGDLLVLDGLEGKVLINPTEATLMEYREKQMNYIHKKKELGKLKDERTISEDGHHVELAANIGGPDDVLGVLNNGGEGIGLYRTEFIYMGRNTLPTEDEQFEAYRKVLEAMGDKPVVVRTLDVGGDKELPYLDLPIEMNPFLGNRAIRLCLKQDSIFRTQLRALLRASVHGNLKIMFPMIALVEEFLEAKNLLLEEKAKLISEGISVADDIEIGIMVEVPSSAMMADQFATEVDFFSIGTNDLIQYTMAADRMNKDVSYLYQPHHPSILRLINMVIEAAHREGKWVGMCGEMAGDHVAIPILLGLGLDEFSMSASSILPARSLISGISKAEMEMHKEKLLALRTSDEVVAYVKNIVKA